MQQEQQELDHPSQEIDKLHSESSKSQLTINEEERSSDDTSTLPEFNPRQIPPDISLTLPEKSHEDLPKENRVVESTALTPIPTEQSRVILFPLRDKISRRKINIAVGKLGKLRTQLEEELTAENEDKFLKAFIQATAVEGEYKLLGNMATGLLKETGELIEAQEVVKKARRDIRRHKYIGVESYLQERKMLRLVNRSVARNSEMVEVLERLVNGNNKSVTQVNQIDTNDIKDQENKEKAQSTKKEDEALKKTKSRFYSTWIHLLEQDKIFLSTLATEIGTNLQRQEGPIRKEAYGRVQEIREMVRENPFHKISSSLDFMMHTMPKYRFVLSPKTGEPIDMVPLDNQEEENIDFNEILKFHNFDIEDPSQYPDYQISYYYLFEINTWVNKDLLDRYKDDYQMIIKNNQKLREIAQLANNLFGNIKPELQTDWMKTVIQKLDFMTNKKSKWAENEKKFFDQYLNAFKFKFKLEGNYLSRKFRDVDNGIDLLSLNGEVLGHYDELFPEETDGRRRARKGNQMVVLDSDGKILFISSGKIGEIGTDGTRPIEQENKKYILIDSEFKTVLNECDEVGNPDNNGNRNFRIENKLFRWSSACENILLEEFNNIGETDIDGNRIFERRNKKDVLINPDLRIIFEDCDEMGRALNEKGDRRFRKGNSLFERNGNTGEVTLIEEFKTLCGLEDDNNRIAIRKNGKYILLDSKFQIVLEDCIMIGNYYTDQDRKIVGSSYLPEPCYLVSMMGEYFLEVKDENGTKQVRQITDNHTYTVHDL